jgi:hypothetical protein
MTDAVLQANKALVRAHYDAVTNSHNPDAIRAQMALDFYDHAAVTAMSADEVIAHSAALHATCRRRWRPWSPKPIWWRRARRAQRALAWHRAHQ